MGIPHALFEEKLEAMKSTKGVLNDTDLTSSDLRELVGQYKNVYVEAKGEQFPSGLFKMFHLFSEYLQFSILKLNWCFLHSVDMSKCCFLPKELVSQQWNMGFP